MWTADDPVFAEITLPLVRGGREEGAGDRVTEAQAAELLRRGDLVDSRQGCAHGRPTALKIPFSDLERRFRR